MYFIYYNKEKAEDIITEINEKEGFPCEAGGIATSIKKHPAADKYALPVGHLAHRQYINELFAQERVENLSEDWFEEEVT